MMSVIFMIMLLIYQIMLGLFIIKCGRLLSIEIRNYIYLIVMLIPLAICIIGGLK